MSGKGELRIKWTEGGTQEAGLAALTGERALSSQSLILQRVTSTPFMSEGPVLSTAI